MSVMETYTSCEGMWALNPTTRIGEQGDDRATSAGELWDCRAQLLTKGLHSAPTRLLGAFGNLTGMRSSREAAPNGIASASLRFLPLR
jgi:hypothetical protein